MHKPPPARNGPGLALTMRSQPMKDASVAPLVRAAVKHRAHGHGPSCEVDVLRSSHCFSFTSKSASESHVRSILLAPQTWHGFTRLPDESLRSNSFISLYRVQGCGTAVSRRQGLCEGDVAADLVCPGGLETCLCPTHAACQGTAVSVSVSGGIS